MKKRSALILLLAMLLLAAAAFPALAAGPPTLTPDANDGFTVEVSVQTLAPATSLTGGGQCLILALEGKFDTPEAAREAITATNIVYIDQAQADGQGTAEFSNFWPLRGGFHTVLVAGDGLAAPQILCYLDDKTSAGGPEPPTPPTTPGGEEVEYYYVTGSFACAAAAKGRPFPVTLTGLDGKVYRADSGYAGVFTFLVPAGTYTLRVPADTSSPQQEVAGYLNYTLRQIPVSNDNVLLDQIKLYGGDFDNSGQVTPADLTLLLAKYNSAKGDGRYEEKYDLDNDGAVNITDLMILIDGFLEKDYVGVYRR